MSNSSEREGRLDNLSRKLGHELDEDFRRAGDKLKDILIRDFGKEMAPADIFVDRNDLTEAAYHRALAYAIHNTLRDLEMMIGR
jgi:hypothetical protein